MKSKRFSICYVLYTFFLVSIFLCLPHAFATTALGGGRRGTVPVSEGPTVTKDERWQLVSTEFGEISAVKINDRSGNECYCLHFITLNPCSLFLPVYLYTNMVFYVNSGNGILSWINFDEEDYELRQTELYKGDVYRLPPQTIFYLESNLESVDKLQIYAIFSDSENELPNKQCTKVYAGLHDLVLGFDNKILQATLNVPNEVIEELRAGEGQPLIVQGQSDTKSVTSTSEFGSRVIRSFLGMHNEDTFDVLNKKKREKKKKDVKKKHEKKKDLKRNKKKAYNIFDADYDVESDNGWSIIVTEDQSDLFEDTDFGVFMVNLTKGSMMGPHWNPTSAEIAIVLEGRGMVQVVCPRIVNETECKNSRFKVAEGDVFVVPRYYPMAQMSFDNESFVFVGFTMTLEDYPTQYVGGKKSILKMLDKEVLTKSFGVSNATLIDEVLSDKRKSVILECVSCAEDEERLMEEERDSEWDGGQGAQPPAEIEGEMARWQEEEMRRRMRDEEEEAREGGVHGRGGEGGPYRR
ncbi:vicilin-like seed storage protein At4g36700 [Rutidosis leptorrhynchoides]|uniref:vicilin-like seed storage protein At4g36700 n=1 Tax=Rutidosis leptorrhynchoides TaxID=125765 RepID=UPI003A9A40DA